MMCLGILLVLIALIIIGVYLHAVIQGEAKVVAHLEKRSKFNLEELSLNRAVFSTEFEITNESEKPDSTIIDAFSRHLLPHEQFDRAIVNTRLERLEYRRQDNYLEAFPLYGASKEKLILTLIIESDEPIQKIIDEIFDIKLEVYVNYVSKEEFKIARWYFWTSKQELQVALERGVTK